MKMEDRLLSDKIWDKVEMKIAISHFQEREKQIPKMKIMQMVATFVVCIGVTVGVVYAGYTVYEKVWKEPKIYHEEEMQSHLPSPEISEEEKVEENLITEEVAKQKALDVLEKLGYGRPEIKKIDLNRGYSGEKENESYYMVKTKEGYEEGLMVLIDSKTGEFTYFSDMELKYKNLTLDEISEEKRKQIAYEVYDTLGFQEKEYELETYNQKTDRLYGCQFYKKYHGVYNRFQGITVGYMVVDGKVLYDTINIYHSNHYEDNEIKLSKEEAQQIAIEKEKVFSDKESKIQKVELSIERMNSVIYQLENNIMGNDIYIKTDNRIRNVWKVTIDHEDKEIFKWATQEEQLQWMKESSKKTYFVDGTTGEIIGGEIGLRVTS